MNIKQAAEDVKSLAKTFKAVQSIGEFLDNVVSLEQVSIESQQAVVKARKAKDEAEQELKVAADNLALAKAKVKEAESQAESIISESKVQASELVAEAKAKALSISKKSDADKQTADDLLKEKQLELVALANQKQELANAVDDLDKKLNALKAKAQAMVG